MTGTEDGKTTSGSPPRRGRPPGSDSLTREREDLIVARRRAGASKKTCAKAAGISVRTLDEWLARGEGRSPKPGLAKHRRLAKGYRAADADATTSAEVRLHQHQPGIWLRNETASSSPLELEHDQSETPSLEQISELARSVLGELLVADRNETVRGCGSPRCRCVLHRPRTDGEQRRLRETAREVDTR